MFKSMRIALLFNLAFSVLSGMALLGLPQLRALLIPPLAPYIVSFVAIGLLVFSTALGYAALKPQPHIVLLISIADIMWIVITAIGSIWLGYKGFMTATIYLCLTNLIVGACAIWQFHAIMAFFKRPGLTKGVYTICLQADTHVLPNAMWRVLSDIGNISKYMPSLKRSTLSHAEQPDIGAIRTCESQTGAIWSERVTHWEEGQSFAVEFLTNQDNFPFPYSFMIGGWRIMPNKRASRIQVWWQLTPKQQSLALLVIPLMYMVLISSFGEVIARMAAEAEGRKMIPTRGKRIRLAIC